MCVYGEQDFAVPPLKIPDVQHLPKLEQLTQFEAVKLFIQRTQAVRPSFTVNNNNAPAVAEICHRLAGLLLAIELAAARVRVFAPDKMVELISQQLNLLTGRARNLPARQQALCDTIDWSYALLAADEQVVFHDLAVFVGSAALDAIGAVCSHPSDKDVFSILEHLMDYYTVKCGVFLVSRTESGQHETSLTPERQDDFVMSGETAHHDILFVQVDSQVAFIAGKHWGRHTTLLLDIIRKVGTDFWVKCQLLIQAQPDWLSQMRISAGGAK